MATLLSSPVTISVEAPVAGLPAYIANLAPGSAMRLASKISDAFAPFAGETGGPIGVYFYSGGAYDNRRHRFLRSGGGHNDHNGNGVYGISIYSSETPAWTLFKPHTSPPSITSFSQPGSDVCPNGDPASTHTYSLLVYDKFNDKLVHFGLGSIAGSSGNPSRKIRALNLSTNTWDGYDAHPSKGSNNNGGMACYDEVARVIWGKDGGNTLLQRFDVVANTISGIEDGLPTMNIDTAVAIDSSRRYMIAIGGYSDLGPLDNGSADMILWDLASSNGSSVKGYARTLSGFPVALRNQKVALEFHPPSGSFVSWQGGNVLYRLIPSANPFTGTWTFQTITPSGTSLPIAGRGVYSGFRWAPYPTDASRGVFVMDCVEGGSGRYSASSVAIYKPNF